MNKQSLISTLFSVNSSTTFHQQLNSNKTILPQHPCLSLLRCMIFIKHNDPYFNCKDIDLPFKQTDSNCHFNSYDVGYTDHLTKHEIISVTFMSNYLNLNIHTVGLSTQYNEATTTCLISPHNLIKLTKPYCLKTYDPL